MRGYPRRKLGPSDGTVEWKFSQTLNYTKMREKGREEGKEGRWREEEREEGEGKKKRRKEGTKDKGRRELGKEEGNTGRGDRGTKGGRNEGREGGRKE